LATVAQRPTGVITASPATRSATPRAARKSIDQWNDREAGIAAVSVVGALGLVLLLIIAGVVLYATGWGYAIALTR
jgi:hypothetical protein